MPRLVLLERRGFVPWALALFTGALLLVLARGGAIQVSARLAEAISGRRVAVDPGHGGIDPGAVGRSGLIEKDLVLEISFHLRRHLGRAGVFVTMIRESDRDYGDSDAGGTLRTRKRRDLAHRVRMTRRARAEIMLSIHANSIPDARWSGAQVFYNPDRPHARELAQSIQSALVARLGPNHRLPKSGDYWILNGLEIPAVTVEVGFLSNPEEEALLGTSEYRARVAKAIYEGVVHYFLLRAEEERREAEPAVFIPVATAGRTKY